MCCPWKEVNSHPRQTYCCRKLQIDFGAVFTISKRLLALGFELKTALHFPLTKMTSAMRQQPAKCVGWLIAFYFLAQGKNNGIGHNKSVTCFLFTFHSFLPRPDTEKVHRPAGWEQLNRAVDV